MGFPLDNSITESFHTARNNESCVKSKAFRCLSSAGAPLDRDAWSGLLQTRQSLLKLRDCVRQGAGLTADLLSLAANQQLTISRLDGRLGKTEAALEELQAVLFQLQQGTGTGASQVHYSVYYCRGSHCFQLLWSKSPEN